MGISAGAGAAIAGGLSAAGGLAGSAMGASAASKSAGAAADIQKQMYLQTRSDLSPWREAGANMLDEEQALARSRTGGGPDYVSAADAIKPGQMTQAELERTPGYQFTLSQGLKSTQSAVGARGLGVSGASMKGAAEYSTGLADKTYMDQFNVAQQRFQNKLSLNTAQQGNLTNQFNRMNTISSLGENAAAQTGNAGTTLANQAGNYTNQQGQAQAAGDVGAGKAIAGGVNNALQYYNYAKNTQPTTSGYTDQGGPSGRGTSQAATDAWNNYLQGY